MRGRSRAFLCASMVALAACRDEAREIERANRAAGAAPIAPEFVGAGADQATGRPLGYPDDVPLVPGAESLSGGVEPGVVSTATLRYRMPRPEYLEALRAALAEGGFEVRDEGVGPTGSQRMRAHKGPRSVSFLVHDEPPITRVDVLSLEPRAPRPGTEEPPR